MVLLLHLNAEMIVNTPEFRREESMNPRAQNRPRIDVCYYSPFPSTVAVI